MAIEQIEPAMLFDANIYLVLGSERCALVDAGTGFGSGVSEGIRRRLGGRRLDYIFLTHRHFDHVGGAAALAEEFRPEAVLAGEADAAPLRSGDPASTLGAEFGGELRPLDVTPVREGDRFPLGGHALVVLETPGHTAGGISLFDEATGALFTGDTLFADGAGRTDLPTGSAEQEAASLRRLWNLDFGALYPGHGPALEAGGREAAERALHCMGARWE